MVVRVHDARVRVRVLLCAPPPHLALVGVQAHICRGEADLPAGLAHDGLVVHLGLGGDFAEHHHHVGLGARLACHLQSSSSIACAHEISASRDGWVMEDQQSGLSRQLNFERVCLPLLQHPSIPTPPAPWSRGPAPGMRPGWHRRPAETRHAASAGWVRCPYP
eukprot:1147098-Pelagomonas_calceolata.AAC.2